MLRYWIWRWRKGPRAQECRQPLETGKAQEMDSSTESSERMLPCWHLGSRTSDLQNCKITSRLGFLKIFIHLFMAALGLGWLRVGLLQLWRVGATLCCGVWVSHCRGFSCFGEQVLDSQASGTAAHGISIIAAHGLSCSVAWGSSGTRDWTLVPCRSRFLTTGPPGRSPLSVPKPLDGGDLLQQN